MPSISSVLSTLIVVSLANAVIFRVGAIREVVTGIKATPKGGTPTGSVLYM